MALTRKDLEDLKNQITRQSFKPSTIFMHPQLWREVSNPIFRLYVAVLKYEWSANSKARPDGTYEITFSHPNTGPSQPGIILEPVELIKMLGTH